MGLYFYFHAVRRVPDPNKDNFFVSDAPRCGGVHSSYMDMLFARTTQINPELSPKPNWYANAFMASGQPITQENFFEPSDIVRDLERITAEIMARNSQLPVFYSLRTGNKAGIEECAPSGPVDIYYEDEPCWVSTDRDNVSIWSARGRVRDITGMKTFDCRLRKKTIAALKKETNSQHIDGLDGTIFIEEQTFFNFMRPYMFDLFTPCTWAMQHRLQIFPMWT
jgi:hypothetical protein